MNKIILTTFVLLFAAASVSKAQINTSDDTPLRVIAIFAHPDDADSKMGGTAAMMAQMGHEVKFLSLTNGDAGHHEEGGGFLGKRRRAEAKEAAERLGIEEYEVFDNHDAELLPELHIRMDVIRAIREWNADVVLGLRPNDYHPDHRNAGQLVIDASYMVIVPNVTPDTEPVPNNPVFLYMQDRFSKPNPFSHDIVVGIDEVIDTKLAGLDAHTSQMYEWLPWTAGRLDEVPEDPDERLEWLRQRWIGREMSEEQRAGLEKWYGPERAAEFKYAESFEIAEYGRYPSEDEIRMIFPMLGN
ncbi:PIG-L deacetylase family protein [Rhodohalobacter sp.]|uniref:PIG-L deacetylase family protein n=1 Tax=Rhodohalobacter sp. TaxID=1974210 RepID=UPI002ACE8EEA|nr:PIG-L family deacetylase [Rhodohalobacter sp.]MDZ7757962.1 PIG-L family deacetylase [Rhodohalobacter sp.]